MSDSDCEGCEHYRTADVKAVPTWRFDGLEIDVIIPVCIRAAHRLAVKRCDWFVPSETVKEMRGII